VPAPQARTIVYNAIFPISALGFKSPTLAQLMARYATMDPILFSATADKRKGLSLIAPPAAKRKRTTKKIPVEVRFPLSQSQGYSYSDKFYLVQFQTRIQQPSVSEPANASSTCMTFITLFPQRSTPTFTLNLIFAEETLVNHPVDIPIPQHVCSPRAEPSSARVEISSSSGTQSSPAQTEVSASPEMNPSVQPEASSPLRVQSPIGQAETPTITEVNPPPLQPEASDLPETAPAPSQTEASALPRAPQTHLSPVAQEIPLKLNKTLPQLRKSGMR
jgi:hypothetical protein